MEDGDFVRKKIIRNSNLMRRKIALQPSKQVVYHKAFVKKTDDECVIWTLKNIRDHTVEYLENNLIKLFEETQSRQPIDQTVLSSESISDDSEGDDDETEYEDELESIEKIKAVPQINRKTGVNNQIGGQRNESKKFTMDAR
jgi:hypothetical protein